MRAAAALAAAAHASGDGPLAVCGILSDAADRTVATLLSDPGAGVAVAAVGGYGRRELCPHSDLDVLLIHRSQPQARVTELTERVFYPLWDLGLEVGHRAYALADAVRQTGILEEAAALLDLRFVAGDRTVVSELGDHVLQQLYRRRATFWRDLGNATRARHDRFGHAGHVLEPNIRDAAGGLRDIQGLSLIERLLPGADLVEAGYVSAEDRAQTRNAYTFLLGVRVEAHLVAGRRQDVLYIEQQDAIAGALGYGDGNELLRDVYLHARETDAICTDVFERATGSRSRPPKRIPQGLAVSDGRVDIVAAPDPSTDPADWIAAFTYADRAGLRVTRSAMHRLRGVQSAPWTPRSVDAFFDAVSLPQVMSALDASGLLGALISAWRHVSALPQRNMYHRWSVDVHSYHVVAELAASRTSDDPAVADAWTYVSDDRALALAALLHDAGKGRGGDHAVIGAAIAAQTATAMGLDPATPEWLVAEHLLLPETAVRRDLSDPATIAAVAQRVGTPERLAMLLLLSRADSIATGPEAWSPFRAALVRELYAAVRDRLLAVAGEGEHATADADVDLPIPPDVQSIAVRLDRDVRLEVSSRSVTVVAPDRPGLLAAVTGVLVVRGIEILSAQIWTVATPSGDVAVEIFDVEFIDGIPDDRRRGSIEHDVREALAGRLDVDEALRAGTSRRRAQLRGIQSAPRVIVDADASPRGVVVEVHAGDRSGLLHAVTQALTVAGCDIRVAKIATYGADVVDVFYVRHVGVDGRPINLDVIRSAVLELL